MPSTTFMNLPKKKRDSLIFAAIEEFSSQTYDDASINSIIKSCSIPRGSFYMYFNDKEDLYFYILSIYQKKIQKSLDAYLVSSDGDIINIFKHLFGTCVKECTRGQNARFFKNLILNMRQFMEHKMLIKNKKHQPEMWKSILDKVNTSRLNITDDNTLSNMLNILFILSIHKLIEYIKSSDDTKKDIIASYMNEMDLLRGGFYKKIKL